MKTYVEFYNEKEDTFVKIPMNYEYGTDSLSVEQRCLAYDELSRIISEDFACNSIIVACEDKE